MAKKSEEERKPDLNEADNQAEIEARIKEMMDLDEPKPVVKPISVTMHDDDQGVSAPEVPASKKPFSIKVIDHNEIEETEAAAPAETDAPSEAETDPDVLSAIEEANKQLMGAKNTPEEVNDPETPSESKELVEEESEEPETTEDADSAQTAPEISEEPEDVVADEVEEAIDSDESISESQESEIEESDEPKIDEVADDSEAESDEPEEIAEPEVPLEKPTKEKPLKHLDSIIPKTKVEETIESGSIDKAVDDIITKEADALLAAEDEKIASAFQPEPKVGFGKKLAGIFKKRGVRRLLLVIFLAGLGAIAASPTTRYFVLNTAGIRSAASIAVFDESTQQPLKGVTVKLGTLEQKTDQDGKVSFTGVKLGPTDLIVEKRAFALSTRELVIGWGSNPLADVSLTPTGTQYTFVVTDFLSGKPVAKVEAVSNEAAAISNEEGEIKLTIDQPDDTPRDVTISGENYRIEKFALNLDQKESLAIKLVPARKHVFISNRGGKFDVYKVDIDGQNEKLVLPGTGSEREDMVLVPHPSDEVAALVSTKDNKRNNDGFLLSTLTVMSLNDDTAKSVVTSERVQIIDWVGSKIVYVQIKEGASGDSPDRHKLVSYDYKSGEFKELASSNYFNDVLIANDKIFVAPSSNNSQSTSSSLVRFNADGTSQQTIINKEVWNIFRTSYDKLTLAVQQDWYELKLGENQAGKISGEPPSQTSRIYMDSPDRTRSLWVENRDGKGVLLAYNSDSKNDHVIRTQGGLKLPVRWLTNSTIVYRVNTESETADYAFNLDGGEPVKIRDVSNTSGINTWYYY